MTTTTPPRPALAGCDRCDVCDEFYNLGRDHFGVCHGHRTTWHLGSNLFSSWHSEDETTWQANLERFADFVRVPVP